MKKNLGIIGLASVCLFSIATAAGRHPASGSESVTVQQAEAFVYVCLPQKGSFEKMSEAIGSLLQQMQFQNVVPAGPMIGIYFNSPAQAKPEDLQWEIGFPITSQSFVQPPLEKKEWNYTTVAVSLHQGPYEKTGETIQKIMDWLTANSYVPAGPILERYQDMNPDELKPEDLKTEIWIPCRKKT
jgi:effector-binding domain-containing protein